MAGFKFKKSKSNIAEQSLCEIDFSVTNSLMRAMDFDEGWEALAKKVQCSTEDFLRLRDMRYRPNGSPTGTLLWELGCKGEKVLDLYVKLKEINRRREMQILDEYARKNKQPPLSTLVPDVEEEEEVDREEALAIASHDLYSLMSQNKTPGSSVSNGKSAVPSFGYDSSTGSAINFNNYSLSQAQYRADPRQNQKAYGEKVIPGTEVGGAADFFPLKPGNSSVSRAEEVEELEDAFACFSKTPSSMYSGADALQRMLNPPSSLYPPLNNVGPSPSFASSNVSNSEMISMSLKPSFSYKELCQATENFSQSNLIGQGAFGDVYKGTLRHLDCAIKRLKQTGMEQGKDMKQFLSELAMLTGFSHENIVVLYGYALEGEKVCLVYQHLVNGSLEDRLLLKSGTTALTWAQRLNILLGACKGLNFLHTSREKPLIHGDIKSANILLDRNWEAKIADLGQAKYATGTSEDTRGYTHVSVVQTKTKLFGTKAYHAPEVLRSGQLSMKSDVFAMGVVFLETCSGLQAYDPNRPMGQFLDRHFKDYDEDQWIEKFQDRHLNKVPGDSFKQVLTLANKCVLENKKHRPKTVKLREGIQLCYSKYLELSTEKCGPVNSSFGLMEDHHIGELQKKLSEATLAESMSVSANPSFQSAPGSRIAKEQEEILRRNSIAQNTPQALQSFTPSNKHMESEITYHTQPCPISFNKGMNLQPCVNSHPGFVVPQSHLTSQQNQQQPQGMQTQSSSDLPIMNSSAGTATLYQEPDYKSADLSNASLEVLYGNSVPIRLQQAYDQRSQANEKRRQEGYQDLNSFSFESLSQESEDIKLKLSAENFNGQLNPSLQQGHSNQHLGPPVEDDYFPKADPKKLQELQAFDESNFSDNHTTSLQTNPTVVAQCDPRKIAYMQKFDDDSFKASSKPAPQLNPMNVSSTNTGNQNQVPCHSPQKYFVPQSIDQSFANNTSINYSPTMNDDGSCHSGVQIPCKYDNPQTDFTSVNPTGVNSVHAAMFHNGFNQGTDCFRHPGEESNVHENPYLMQTVTSMPEQAATVKEFDPNYPQVSDTYYTQVADQSCQQMKEKNMKKTPLDDFMAEILDDDFCDVDS